MAPIKVQGPDQKGLAQWGEVCPPFSLGYTSSLQAFRHCGLESRNEVIRFQDATAIVLYVMRVERRETDVLHRIFWAESRGWMGVCVVAEILTRFIARTMKNAILI